MEDLFLFYGRCSGSFCTDFKNPTTIQKLDVEKPYQGRKFQIDYCINIQYFCVMAFSEHDLSSTLLSRPDIWQASTLQQQNAGIDTGFSRLNRALHQGGWPDGGLLELLPDHPGTSEFSLLSPCLTALSRQSRWIVLIAPPHIPYAPAWAQTGIDLRRILMVQPRNPTDLLWCTEQALRSGCCSAVLSWLTSHDTSYKNLRKLQIAAQCTAGLSVLIRPQSCAQQHSPAKLRTTLSIGKDQIQLDILKQQGGWGGQRVSLPLSHQLTQRQLPVDKLPVYRVTVNKPLSDNAPLGKLGGIGKPSSPKIEALTTPLN